MSDAISHLIEQQADALAAISDSPKLDAQILLSKAVNKGREWLLAHGDDSISCEQRAQFMQLIQRRLNGEPIAYITGSRGFWQREFQVNRATLIPRPETELLIEIILERFDEQPRRMLDLGTGTGAIAVSIAAERPNWQVMAIDIDSEAVKVATVNAGSLPNIVIQAGNWFEGLDQQFDLIVSNPPYIAEDDPHLQQLSYEPAKALVSGKDGLDDIRRIVSNAETYLCEGGHLMLEHGFDQQERIVALLQAAGFVKTEIFSDLSGQPRAVLTSRESE